MRGAKLFRSLPRLPWRNGWTIGLISSYRAMFLTSVSNSYLRPGVDGQVVTDAPVVLDEHRHMVVVRVRNDERLVGFAAAKRHGEEQIVVVHLAVAVVIEIGKVLHQLDAAVLEHSEVETRIDALPLTAEPQTVRALDHGRGIGQLEPALIGALRHTERRAVLDARERQLRSLLDRHDGVVERAERNRGGVQQRGRHDPGPRADHGLIPVLAGLPLTRRPDGAIDTAGRRVGRFLTRVANEHGVGVRWPVVHSCGSKKIVERCRSKGPRDGLVGGVATAHEHRAVLVSVLDRAKPERLLRNQRTANCGGVLLAIEGRRTAVRAIVGDRQGLQARIATEERRRSVETVATRFRHDVDRR